MRIVFLMHDKLILKDLSVYVIHGAKKNVMMDSVIVGHNGQGSHKKMMAFFGCVRTSCFVFLESNL